MKKSASGRVSSTRKYSGAYLSKLKVLDKIREGIVREWKGEDELDRVGYMNFYMGMKYAIEFILNESEFYEY